MRSSIRSGMTLFRMTFVGVVIAGLTGNLQKKE